MKEPREIVIYREVFISKSIQGRIQNPLEHLRWSFVQKYLTAFRHQLFLQKTLVWMGFECASVIISFRLRGIFPQKSCEGL